MELPPGTRLGAYEVVREAGRGATGVVYVAEHVHLGREVALKVLSGEYARDPQLAERFVRESRLAASLDHEHIIPIYDAGEAEGRPYLAMKLVTGPDLATVVEAHPRGLPLARTLRLLAQIGSALDAAAELGLLHRDVKPANVVVEGRSGGEHAYLTDFGLAKHHAATTLTRPDQLVGTLLYIAPEQIEGRATTGATDQYSLGCVAYELLTGSPPFSAGAGTSVALVHAHLTKPPPPVTAARPDLPPAVDAVVARAMAKDPAVRFPTCAAFVEAAAAALAADPVTAVPVPAPTFPAVAAGPPGPEREPTAQLSGDAISAAGHDSWPGVDVGRPPPRRRAGVVVGVVVALAVVGATAVTVARRGLDAGGEAAGAGLAGAASTATGTAGVGVGTAGDGTGTRTTTAGGDGGRSLATVGRPGTTDRVAYVAGTGGEADIHVVDATPGAEPVAWTDDDVEDRQPAWLPDGGLVVARAEGDGSFTLWRVAAPGADPERLTDGAFDADPAVSPDGTRIAFSRLVDGGFKLHVLDLVTSTVAQLTTGPGNALRATWSPAGDRVAFHTDRAGGNDVLALDVPATGSAPSADFDVLAADPDLGEFHPAWAPDGATVLFTVEQDGTQELVEVPASGGPRAVVVSDGPGTQVRDGDWSSDGAGVAFVREHADGTTSVAVLDLERGEPLVSVDGASDPVW